METLPAGLCTSLRAVPISQKPGVFRGPCREVWGEGLHLDQWFLRGHTLTGGQVDL